MRAVLGRWVDPFVVTLLVVLVLGLVVPVGPGAQRVVDAAADVAVTVLFLVYGMRLSTREVWAGLRNWRLQGGILAATYVVFPVLGLVTAWAIEPLVGAPLAAGMLYLSLLPSTVQSSVAFTSVARGNVAGAICGATVSNVAGMVITPLLVLWLMTGTGGGADGPTGGLGGLRTVLLQLLLPFVVGQLLQPWAGDGVRARRWLTLGVDRGTILVVVFGAVAAASSAGVWSSVSGWSIVALLVVSAIVLAVMLAATWWGGAALGLSTEDRVALLMCGSKKSLATGLPMASVLFPVAVAGVVAVPVIVFHQLQLVVCAVLARRLALRD
ncbi:bile acid:sodium symporter [Cellulosimicrobium aquatile]|uniref:bile acid:sodium symporter n=1 Tax=Cellulosimicrobium aquatile TaxID=1612203 RepID=UPI0014597FBD|nr:bile acid:sodium symporter [Cellulosimicrobium aquatile]